MKRQIFNIINSLVAIVLCATMAHAQKNNSIHMQYSMVGNAASIHYEHKIMEKPSYTMSATIGFQYANHKHFRGNPLAIYAENYAHPSVTTLNYRTYSIPVGITTLVGKRNHKLEAGFGLSINSIHHTVESYARGRFVKQNFTNYTPYCNIGYRYEFKNRVILRCGVNAIYDQDDIAYFPSPYVGIGSYF